MPSTTATAAEKRFGRDPFALLIVVLAGLGTAHILVRTAPYGPAVSPDSVHYLSTAINFLAGEGWRDFLGRPLVGFPPLFPLLLAASGWLGIEPFAAAQWINATAFGLTILVAGCWLRSISWSQWLALAATTAITVSLPYSEFASRLMTDSLFALLTLLVLTQLSSFLQRGRRTPLYWMAVFTALAAVTRYAGVVLIGVGVLMLLVRRTPPLAVRLKDAIVFGAISSLPLAVVLTRNKMISGTLTARSGASGQSLSAGLYQIGETFRQWVGLSNGLDGLGYLLYTAVGLVVVAGVVVEVAWRGRYGRAGWRGTGRTASPRLGLGPALPFGVFALIYCVFLVAVVPFTVYQGIDSRYLLPVYVPLLLAAALLLDRFLSIEAAGRLAAAKWGLASLVLLGALAHVSLSTYGNLRITRQSMESQVKSKTYETNNYKVAYWHHSETLKYIRTHLSDSRTFSNDPGIIWFWDRSAALRKHLYIADSIDQVTPRIMRKTKKGIGGPIVWILEERPNPHSTYDDLDLRCLPGVETVAELADGVVFRVTAAEPFDAKRHRVCKQRSLWGLIQQAGEPVVRAHWVRAHWDVYRTGRELIYVKQPCTPADTQAKFILHVIPADLADLPADRQRYGSDNFDFYFDRRGFRVGDQCMATVHLPGYPIDRIYRSLRGPGIPNALKYTTVC